ncbi:MAG: hypothetical protein H6739_36990 [Alphaproteobacteria bacterium]|nr:hypothetical protein [Alphaproteobacteria bacterium]
MRRRRPEGLPTRGKTAPDRLRRLDAFLSLYDPALLAPWGRLASGVCVDLGFGRLPLTTVQLLRTLRRHDPGARVIGVELDPERVAAAEPYAGPGLTFRRGGFNLPLEPGEGVRLIRAMNVLRQYPPERCVGTHADLVAQLLPGGLLLEGTSDPFGQVMAVSVMRRRGDAPHLEALLFATNMRQGGHPDIFPPVLPRHLIQRMVPGEPIFRFFERWRHAWACAAPAGSFGERQRWARAAEILADDWPGVLAQRRWLRRGMLVWRNPPYP